MPELLSLSDRDFVENAYRTLLRRGPDPGGMSHHLERLRDGRSSKVEVLAALRWSPEGEIQGVHVDGLLAPFLLQKWRRKRWVGPVLGWFQSFARLSRLSERQAVLDAAQAREAQELGGVVNLQAQQVEHLFARLESTLSSHGAALAHAAAQVGVVSARLDSMDTLIARVDAAPDVVPVIRVLAERLERISEQEAGLLGRVEVLDQALQPLLARAQEIQRNSVDMDPLLVAFEDAFRGGRQAMRARIEPYVDLVREAGAGSPEAPVLDLASGRGEWLELLKERQLVGRGVDSNRLFVEAGNGRGLQLTHGRAVDVLASLADASIGAVTVMRQADHLPLAELVEILDHSLRVLRPGGLLLLHGFNAENVVLAATETGMQGKPLPPEVMRWLVEARGFYSAHIARPAARDTAPVTASAPRNLAMASAAVVPFEANQLSSECTVVARKLS